MKNKDTYNAHKYTDANSCLFVSDKGKLLRVKCPFKVILATTPNVPHIGLLLSTQLFLVTSVLSIDNRIYFEINGNPMPCSNYYLDESAL